MDKGGEARYLVRIRFGSLTGGKVQLEAFCVSAEDTANASESRSVSNMPVNQAQAFLSYRQTSVSNSKVHTSRVPSPSYRSSKIGEPVIGQVMPRGARLGDLAYQLLRRT